jgi:hypothetical protein
VAHVLPVSDDGGSTAEIVRVIGGPAVGDIRSRCLRLADDRDEEVRQPAAADVAAARAVHHSLLQAQRITACMLLHCKHQIIGFFNQVEHSRARCQLCPDAGRSSNLSRFLAMTSALLVSANASCRHEQ